MNGAALKRWPELNGASIRLGVGDGAAACLGSGCVGLRSDGISVRIFLLHLVDRISLKKMPRKFTYLQDFFAKGVLAATEASVNGALE